MHDTGDIKTLITVAENMVAHLPIVPAAPLQIAQEYADRVIGDLWTNEADDLLDAIESVEWDYWQTDDDPPTMAMADIFHLSVVANKLRLLKESLNEPEVCEHNLCTGGMCENCQTQLQENQMGFETALALLKKGVAVTRLGWPEGSMIEMYQDRIRYYWDSETYFWRPTDADLLATDWALVGTEEDLKST